jgi:hypothetical protein
LPNYYALFVFTNQQRLANAMTLLGSTCSGSKFILFQQTRVDAPAGYIFTSPCERLGYSPLQLSQP